AASSCVAGMCVTGTCLTGWGDCNTDPKDGCETSLHVDPKNCGGCGRTCTYANGIGACADVCYLAACKFGFDDCNEEPKDGCETSTVTDKKNCGGCGMPCMPKANANGDCINATCTITSCFTGFLDCDFKEANGC